MTGHPVPPGRLWWLAAGFAVWGSALVVLYALHGIGCAFGWHTGPLRVALFAVLLAHLAVIGWMWRELLAAPPDPEHGRLGAFLHTVALWTLIAALASIFFTLAPPLLLTTCT